MESEAAARAGWRIEKRPLRDPRAEPATGATPTERLGMMWELATSAWLLAGRSLPDYARGEAPIRRRRLADTASSDGTD